jgi:hypothetical protein
MNRLTAVKSVLCVADIYRTFVVSFHSFSGEVLCDPLQCDVSGQCSGELLDSSPAYSHYECQVRNAFTVGCINREEVIRLNEKHVLITLQMFGHIRPHIDDTH